MVLTRQLPVRLSAVGPAGRVYRRVRKASEISGYLHAKEEVLNHIFDLTFAIAPDTMIQDVLLSPFGFMDAGPFESIGREAYRRYGFSKNANVTQPDSLFVSAKTALGAELKLRAPSSRNQIAKYAAILACEERKTGRELQLGLLYIVPEGSLERFWRRCGLSGAHLDDVSPDELIAGLNEEVRKLISQDPAAFCSAFKRVKLAVVSWTDILHRVQRIRGSLDLHVPGDQTLARLIDGFVAQLEAHNYTGIDRNPIGNPAAESGV